MKSSVFFVFSLFFLLPFGLSSQTTLEEWNYMTKGYAYERNLGLDGKDGYRVERAGEYVYDTHRERRTIVFRRLIREFSNSVCGIIVEYRRMDSKKEDIVFFAIPHKYSEPYIWDFCNAQIETFDGELIGKAFTQALFLFISQNDL